MLFRYSTLAVATTLLATATALSPTDIPSDLPVSSLLTSAQDHLSKGETSEALIYYDAAVDRDSSNYLTLFKRGATNLSLGRANQAANDFNKVLALKPGFEGAHVQLAKLKAKTADWESARVQFAAANKGADSPDVIELEEAHSAATLAETAFNDSKWDDCVNHAGIAIMVASRSAHLREMRAHCRSERDEPREAMSDLQHVLGLRPGDITPHVTISATSFYGLGDMENGMAQVRKCLQSDPDSKPCKKLHRKQKVISKAFGKVQGQLSRGQSTTAGRSLVGTEEDSGLISDIKGQIEELRQAGSILGQSQPKLYESVIELTCQAYSESNHKDTDKYCDEALEMNPESFWGLLRRGKKLLKQEDFEAAINTLQQAAEAHPQNQDKIHPVLQKAQIELKRSKTKDYYKVLGVQNDADEKQIKSAYRKASKQFHPDKAAKQGIAKEDAEKKMAAVNEAYEVLGDPELRARFDRGDDPNSQEPGSPFQGSPFGGRQPHFQFQQGGQRMKNGFPFGGGGGGGGGFEGGFGGFGF